MGNSQNNFQTMLRNIIIIFTLLSTACTGEQEIILLPNGLTGVVQIFFNTKSGSEPEYESGNRVYRIPANGILCTKFKPNEGIRKAHTTLYQIRGDKRIPIEKFSIKEYQLEVGKDMLSGNNDSEIVFIRFVVAKPQDADSLIQLKESLDAGKVCQ